MDPRALALFTRPDTFRLFARVEDPVLDEAGNARTARVFHLGIDAAGWPAWIPWAIGECLHWHPFRIALLSTRRAGLHLISEWTQGSGERRYGANFSLSAPGILVLTPCNVLTAAEPLDAALASPVEHRHLDHVLRERFRFPRLARSPVAMLDRIPTLVAPPPGPGHARAIHPLAAKAA